MLNLKLASVVEKNKLQQSDPWLVLLEVFFQPENQPADVLRVVANTDPINYRGYEFIAFNFLLDSIEQKTQGEIPQVALRVSNINGLLQAELEGLDGGVGATVKIMIVHAKNLAGEPELEMDFTILSTVCEPEYVTFTLGGENPLRKIYPRNLYMASLCRHQYNTPAMQLLLDPRGAFCNYIGVLPSCDKTLEGDNGCRAHDNVINFGGQPGIDTAGFRRATP